MMNATRWVVLVACTLGMALQAGAQQGRAGSKGEAEARSEKGDSDDARERARERMEEAKARARERMEEGSARGGEKAATGTATGSPAAPNPEAAEKGQMIRALAANRPSREAPERPEVLAARRKVRDAIARGDVKAAREAAREAAQERRSPQAGDKPGHPETASARRGPPEAERLARLDALRARFGRPSASPKSVSPKLRAELRLHARRLALVERLRELAHERDQESLTERVEVLLELEHARHERRLARIGNEAFSVDGKAGKPTGPERDQAEENEE